ncbi:hypothetical protein SAMN05216480_12335 [Pustulibacterium marinum]|uniref:Uncharacterized protein n=1 Tax=Pustulibacterium marinum TaxID=1224947 RepID=A0A1I7IWG5_9FLAO|nr:hypothetical protein [Pustulibacterium marinum]SFU77263.1 hypothetical protein SAMN05216480_12335 [Pustulibacterium marinum]
MTSILVVHSKGSDFFPDIEIITNDDIKLVVGYKTTPECLPEKFVSHHAKADTVQATATFSLKDIIKTLLIESY